MPLITGLNTSSLHIRRVYDFRMPQFVVCPVNQIEDGVTTRKKDATHFVYRAGLISDESILHVLFGGPHRNESVFL